MAFFAGRFCHGPAAAIAACSCSRTKSLGGLPTFGGFRRVAQHARSAELLRGSLGQKQLVMLGCVVVPDPDTSPVRSAVIACQP